MLLAFAAGVVAIAGEAAAEEAAPAAQIAGTNLRVGVGMGESTLDLALRLEVAVERWLAPQVAIGGRVHLDDDSEITLFGDPARRQRLGVEPYVQVASAEKRLRAVAQGGVGVGAARAFHPGEGDCFDLGADGGCPPETDGSWGPYRPVPTASVAVGLSSRRSSVVTLLRVEADGEATALWLGLQVGGRNPGLSGR